MATVLTEEEKQRKAREQGGGLGVVNQSGPSLNAPWYSREYATAANMSDKSGLDLERGRAAGAVGLPENDPMRRLAAVGTLSTGVAPAAPAAPKPTATAPFPASQNQRMEGGPIATPGAPGTTQNPIIAKPGESVQQAAQSGGGAITKRVGANGVTEYSGMNVGLNPEFLNGSGQSFKPRGSVVTAPSISGVVTPVSGGYAFANAPSEADKAKAAAMGGRLDQYGNVITAQVDKALTKPDGTRWNANDMAALAASQQQPDSRMAMMGSGTNTGGFGLLDANYQRERALRMDAADSRNQGESRRAYEARIAGAVGALNTFRGEQTAAPRLAAAQKSADAKTQADMAMASRKMAFDEAQGGARMGLDVLRQTDEAKTNAMRRDATGMEIEKAKALDSARQEYLAAGDDPAKQKLAARKLAAFGIKDGQKEGGKWDSIVVGGGVNEQGMKVGGTAMLYNNSTAEVRPIGGQQEQAGAGQAPTAKNIAALKADPSLAAAFDQQFGAGASKQYIQGK